MYGQIVTIIAKQLNIPASKIEPDTLIVDELGADPLNVVEILMALENEFDIFVPDEEIEKLRTPTDIQQYILSQKDG